VGHHGLLLYRAPCVAVSWGRQAAQRESTGGRLLFASTGMCCRKARRQLMDLPGMDARQAPSGVPFSLGYFSFTPGILPFALRASFAVRTRSCTYVDKQNRSNSAAASGRKLFAFECSKSIAHKCAPIYDVADEKPPLAIQSRRIYSMPSPSMPAIPAASNPASALNRRPRSA
jgi:hypothetical protein